MQVALLTSFAASKKEPLADMMDRVHKAFLDAGLGEPIVRFSFSDAPVAGSVSGVDRVLKRHPELTPFVTSPSPMPEIPGSRRISSEQASGVSCETVPFSTLRTIAAGVPRSFPFHNVTFHFHSAAFGNVGLAIAGSHGAVAGVLLSDSWWVNGRNRSLSACTIVDADTAGKALPPLPEAVAAVLAACGKIKRTIQAPLPGGTAAAPAAAPSIDPQVALAVRAVVADYRARLKEVVDRAALPHELPPGADALREGLGATSGPRKPALDRAFKPMGYACKSGSGTFSLRRHTPGNLTVELYLDVGTWSRSVLAIFRILGMGFKASLNIPVSAASMAAGQYPIGDAARWQKIVENLAALVAELDRSFVPEIEKAAGPSPEWYRPES